MSTDQKVQESKSYWLEMLENWKVQTGKEKPRMILLAIGVGGQRAALWITNALQYVDFVMNRELMKETFMITSASGGLIGAAFLETFIGEARIPQIKCT